MKNHEATERRPAARCRAKVKASRRLRNARRRVNVSVHPPARIGQTSCPRSVQLSFSLCSLAEWSTGHHEAGEYKHVNGCITTLCESIFRDQRLTYTNASARSMRKLAALRTRTCRHQKCDSPPCSRLGALTQSGITAHPPAAFRRPPLMSETRVGQEGKQL